jgi:hypothetical protein
MAGSGEVRIQQADPERDRDRILEVLARNLPPAAAADRHEWLYLRNPCGRSPVWLALDATTGEPVGTSAGHIKRVRVAGRTELALNLSDFAIDRGYRSLGPALALLRATLEPMRQGVFAFSYDHPTDAMLAIYQRIGGRSVSSNQRWVRLLRATPLVRRRFGDGVGSRLAGRAGDLALHMRDMLRRPDRRISVELLQGQPGREFDRLDEELAGDAPVRLARSSAYLSWRYLQSTPARHEILCARADGRLAGYLVFRAEGDESLEIVDLMTMPAMSVPLALIDAIVRVGRARGAAALWATALANSGTARLLPALGFVRRESCNGAVIYGPKAAPETVAALADPNNWWTLRGDEDV